MKKLVLTTLSILLSVSTLAPASGLETPKTEIGICSKNSLNKIKIYQSNTYKCILVSSKPYNKYRYILQNVKTKKQNITDYYSSTKIIEGYRSLSNIINSSQPADLTNISYLVDPTVKEKYITQLKKSISKAATYFQNTYPDMNLPIRVYVYSSYNFQELYNLLINDLTPQALEGNWLDAKKDHTLLDPNNNYGGGAAGYGKDGTAVIFYYLNENSNTQINQLETMVHEAIHIYQRKLLNGMGTMPCWVREGQANYLGYMLSADKEEDLLTLWKAQYFMVDNHYSTKDFSKLNFDQWYSWLIEQETHSNLECDAYSNYLYGTITYSYLYGTYGAEKVSAFFKNINNYPKAQNLKEGYVGDSWLKAYEETFATYAQADYYIIAKYLQNEALWYQSAPKNLYN